MGASKCAKPGKTVAYIGIISMAALRTISGFSAATENSKDSRSSVSKACISITLENGEGDMSGS